MSESFNLNIELPVYKALFKARNDVFAIRWEKGKKSGYMPAYTFDRYLYKQHLFGGGTFKTFNDKSFLPLSDLEINKHLTGEQQIGVYPRLHDNTSWFIAADFDESNWKESCIAIIKTCAGKNIPAYLERSRSGNGGHVWLFFDHPYPAFKSRKILLQLLKQSGSISEFENESGFDRLFPNQDYHSGKGLGNLIALPLFSPALDIGNSCFIDYETCIPFSNQWDFLRSVRRVSTKLLDDIFKEMSLDNTIKPFADQKLTIRLSRTIILQKQLIPLQLKSFLKDELAFANSEYFIKKNSGKTTFNTKMFFKAFEETETELILPRGFIGKLLRYCNQQKISFEFKDLRENKNPVNFEFTSSLNEFQKPVIDAVSKKDFGIIVAPPGTGKTVMALYTIYLKKQPALIIVHRKQLLEQWQQRIASFLGIPIHEIAVFGKKDKGTNSIMLATIQSLHKQTGTEAFEAIKNRFGTIIIDECHHIPAESYSNVLSTLNTTYLYGLTATPFRKYSDGKLIFLNIGDVIAEVNPKAVGVNNRVSIIIHETNFHCPFNPKSDSTETLSRMLVNDTNRNNLIVNDVSHVLNKGQRALIISERKDHLSALEMYLNKNYEVIELTGDDSQTSRKEKWKQIADGHFQLLLTTGQFLGEGADIINIHCLFLVYPFSYTGKLIQYIGRVQRSNVVPVIYDYDDLQVDYLHKLFLKRNAYYRKLDRQQLLATDPEETFEIKPNDHLLLEKIIKVSLGDLKFQYGIIAFIYKSNEIHFPIEFIMEHFDIRPEFEVLKPFLEKVFGKKTVDISILVELEKGKLVAQSAESTDLQKINQELISGMKFQFIQKPFYSKPGISDSNSLNTKECLANQLFPSENELLSIALKNSDARHSLHLKYLAGLHEALLGKIRYILQPFSFIFVIKGESHSFVVLETYDTEEATYLWQLDPNKFHYDLQKINLALETIRTKGRQVILTNPPPNFSRIVHDYTDKMKGFIQWKSVLEERLV